MQLYRFANTHYDILQDAREFWDNVAIKGAHRVNLEQIETSVSYLYNRAGLPAPRIIVSENPLEHTSRYLMMQSETSGNGEQIFFTNIFEEMLIRWTDEISSQIEDFSPFAETKAKMLSLFSTEAPMMYLSYLDIDSKLIKLFPSLMYHLQFDLSHGIHSVLCACFFNKDNTSEGFKKAYQKWTGNVLAAESQSFGPNFSEQQVLKAIWSNSNSELNHLYALAPIYDFFFRTGILTDPSFPLIKQLLSGGLLTIVPLQHVCLMSRLPYQIELKKGAIHASKEAAVRFAGGFELYYWNNRFFPAKWLLKPEDLETEDIEARMDRKAQALLYKLAGAKKMATLIGIEVVGEAKVNHFNYVLYQTTKAPWPLESRLYFIRIVHEQKGEIIFQCLSPTFSRDLHRDILTVDENGALTKDNRDFREKLLHLMTRWSTQKNNRSYNPFAE